MTRWRRYGKDRLFVKTFDGLDVGFIDLLSGNVEVHAPEFDQELRALAPAGGPKWSATDISSAEVAPAASPFGYDVTENRPGAAVRAKRQEVNGQAPVWNLVARALGVKTDERSWRVGAKGEEKVGRELAKLPDGWHSLHAVPIGQRGSDIDHVVIGPRGVFTLNTKNHPGGSVYLYENAVWVDGRSVNYLHNSRFEAKRVAKLLTKACATPVDVQAAIVFVDPAQLIRKGSPPDVHVITRRTLRTFLSQQPPRLTAAQVEHIYTVARNSLTWQPT